MNQYTDLVNILIDKHFDLYFKNEVENGNHSSLNMVKYTLTNGKRIRPSIIMDIINTLNPSFNPNFEVLCIEYIHSASLVIDDLPCMDNAKQRRGQDCTHIKYSEANAQLSSIILLSMGMDSIMYYKDHTQFKKILPLLSGMLGINGAAGGQLLDLNGGCKPNELIYKKTGKFFEFCFMVGWIIGGGTDQRLEEVKDLAYKFSMVFQIIDFRYM